MKKSIDLKLQQKKYTKTYHIICSLCRSTHMKSNKIRFSIIFLKDSAKIKKRKKRQNHATVAKPGCKTTLGV